MKQRDAKVREYCKRIGHTKEGWCWAEENDIRQRQHPQIDVAQDPLRDDGVHMISARSENLEKIKGDRDGQALPKQVAMDVEEAENQHRPVAGGTRRGAARGRKKNARKDVDIAQMAPPYDVLAELARDNCDMTFGQFLRGDARTAEAELTKAISGRHRRVARRNGPRRKNTSTGAAEVSIERKDAH